LTIASALWLIQDRVLGKSDFVVARPDLFDQDVCLPGVPGNIADHAQIDEPQVHRADQTVFGGVVQAVVRGDFPWTSYRPRRTRR